MAANLLRATWTNLDSYELRIVLAAHIGHPGRFDELAKNRDRTIVAIRPGPAFDGAEWRISEEIEKSVRSDEGRPRLQFQQPVLA